MLCNKNLRCQRNKSSEFIDYFITTLPTYYKGKTSIIVLRKLSVLFLIGKISSINIVNPYFILLLKLPSIIADIATSYFIYKLAKKYLSAEVSLLLSVFYIFNPAIFIDSTFWGQVDHFFAFPIVLAVFLLSEKKIGFSSAVFTAAVLMKPQGIIFLPILFFELVRQKEI